MNNKSYFYFLPVLIIAGWAAAQVFNPPKGPHNGEVKAAGDFYVEAGVADQYMFAYLLDSSMNEIRNEGITGIAVFTFPDKTVGNLDLYPVGKYEFRGTLIDEKFTVCTISFERNGKVISARYESGTLEATTKPNQ